jgi:RNA polymerase sigma factor (sigma-70 family)
MAQSSTPSFFPLSSSPDHFLFTWDDDVRKASRAAARRICGTREDAEDFAQEVRIRLFPLVGKPQAAAPRYIRKVVANAIKTATERIDTTTFEEITEETEQIPGAPTDTRISEVTAWIDTLPFRLRTVYQHLYVDGLTQREAATVMGVTQPRIAQLHARLLDAGRRDLQHLAA